MAQQPFDLYALDPAAKRAMEAEDRFKADLKTKNKFRARPKTGSTARSAAPPARNMQTQGDGSRLTAGYDPVTDRFFRALGNTLGNQNVTENLRFIDKNLLNMSNAENAAFNFGRGEGTLSDAIDIALAAPMAGVVARPLGVVGRGLRTAARMAPGAERVANLAARVAQSRPVQYMAEARPVLDNIPQFTVTKDGDFLRVARQGVEPQIVPEAKTASNIDALRVILQNPETNPAARAADEYTQAAFGRPYDVNMPAPGTSLQKQSGIARVFEAGAEGSPEYKHAIFEAYGNQMPQVVEEAGAQNYDQLTEAAYRKLGDEVRQQFAVMPVRTSYHYGAGEYATPSAMLRDVLGEGNLNVFRGGEPHEFLGEVDPNTQLSLNEMFRAVHDFYGHGTRGSTFRPGGEELAYASHSQMMSPLAQMALLSETRGQNSLVNYSPLNAKVIGEMNQIRAAMDEEMRMARMRGQKLDPSVFAEQNARLRELGSQIEYAPQKSLLLPPEFLPPDTAGGVPGYLRAAITPRAPSGPERAVHMSRIENLSETDPAFYGTGHRGEDWKMRGGRGSPTEQTSFYLGAPGTVIPEKVVADVNPFAYETELSGLYDISKDPEGIVALARAHNFGRSAIPDFARMVREYGYAGYKTPEFVSTPGQGAATVFEPVKLKRRIKRKEKGYALGGEISVKPSKLKGARS